ncbi:MAG: tetratricopeptide repeat protein [Bacteroidota bacterium]|jgi:tetratricopeptide (TPR) repeat protein|nr:tetratricopeptide repeat protein [Bacteroidota bacterium]
MKRFLVILLVLITGKNLAQRAQVDSLLKVVSEEKADTNKVNSLHELVRLFSSQNADSAMHFGKQALSLSEKLNWQKGIALSHHKIGRLHDGKGEYPLALEEYNKALKFWKDIEISSDKNDLPAAKAGKAQTLTNMGNDHSMQANFPKALDYSFQALKIADEIGNTYLQANNNANIGSVFNMQKEYSKALEYYFKALSMYEKMQMPSGVAYCYLGIGNTYNDEKKYDKALEFYYKSLKINEETGNASYIAANLGNIGSAYSRQGKNDKALECFLRALTLDEQSGNSIGMAYRFSSLGALYIEEKKYDKAKEYLQKGLKLSEDIGSLSLQEDNHRLLSEVYSHVTDYRSSLEHYKKYSVLKDSIFNEEKNNELTRHELNYEFEKKEAELKAEQDKKEAVALAEKKKQNVFFWLMCAIATAVGVIAVLIFRSLTITRRQKRVIESQKLQVEAKQKEVYASIHYAKRIQLSLLPSDSYIEKTMKRMKGTDGRK